MCGCNKNNNKRVVSVHHNAQHIKLCPKCKSKLKKIYVYDHNKKINLLITKCTNNSCNYKEK